MCLNILIVCMKSLKRDTCFIFTKYYLWHIHTCIDTMLGSYVPGFRSVIFVYLLVVFWFCFSRVAPFLFSDVSMPETQNQLSSKLAHLSVSQFLRALDGFLRKLKVFHLEWYFAYFLSVLPVLSCLKLCFVSRDWDRPLKEPRKWRWQDDIPSGGI